MKIVIFYFFLLFTTNTFSQHLAAGFDKAEYKELMLVNVRSGQSESYIKQFPAPTQFKMAYQSHSIGLDNAWDLWLNDKKVAVISIRGTTRKTESWLANLYSAMVPAKGTLQLSAKESFTYELASNPKAAVHTGWLISLAYLSKEILPKIDSCYKTGTREILLMGHSQGGAITFLLTAYLYNLQKKGLLPADIRFKTYCSAAPKPGNLFFAYEYEAMTQNGWAFNVINSADWVPEGPLSVQTRRDFNTINPFEDAEPLIKKQKFPKNIVFRYLYHSLNKPSQKTQKTYEKYLGKMLAKQVQKYLPEFIPPPYFPSSNYVRTGTTIVLLADENYYKKFPDDKANIFCHHLHFQYLYFLDRP